MTQLGIGWQFFHGNLPPEAHQPHRTIARAERSQPRIGRKCHAPHVAVILFDQVRGSGKPPSGGGFAQSDSLSAADHDLSPVRRKGQLIRVAQAAVHSPGELLLGGAGECEHLADQLYVCA